MVAAATWRRFNDGCSMPGLLLFATQVPGLACAFIKPLDRAGSNSSDRAGGVRYDTRRLGLNRQHRRVDIFRLGRDRMAADRTTSHCFGHQGPKSLRVVCRPPTSAMIRRGAGTYVLWERHP